MTSLRRPKLLETHLQQSHIDQMASAVQLRMPKPTSRIHLLRYLIPGRELSRFEFPPMPDDTIRVEPHILDDELGTSTRYETEVAWLPTAVGVKNGAVQGNSRP